ncbi:unnamed protein product [Peronospora belbahrii]|uniref:Uncharacterized protein n=1 Tax=Peronospora belbahrii TaxID=622444 RepID=A0AAU9L7F0_9STRA|nr:unnamed protein product [Peronospora belbahrii]CAH0519156.1 unnamed protein product [Peronospora belbahrii]
MTNTRFEIIIIYKFVFVTLKLPEDSENRKHIEKSLPTLTTPTTPCKEDHLLHKSSEQVSQQTVFTREADVEGWVFLAEERHSQPGSKTRSYADVVAGRT